MPLWLLLSCIARSTWPNPDHTGTLGALSAEARILLDDRGVPHITAADMDDAAAATGWMHARDRGFQLELLRMAGQGRLTELFGDSLLETDRALRVLTWGLDEQVAGMPPEELRRIERYCQGVDAGYRDNPQPLEFKLLGLEPAPWTPRDVISVARLQAWDTTNNAEMEAIRDRARLALPAETFDWLTATSPALGSSILQPDPGAWPDLSAMPAPPAGPLATQTTGPAPPRAAPRATAEIVTRAIRSSGSNAFAVSGAHTADGRPLVAGDPHLSLPSPAFFYEVVIDTPDLDVAGATVPGLPAIIIGQSGSVLWSVTNSYADVQDLYRVEVDGSRYRLDGEWVEMTPWPQTFQLDEGPVEEMFWGTAHGPIYNPGREDELAATYAIDWIGFDPTPLTINTGLERFYRATDPEAVVEALAGVSYPTQSFVWALESGEIGYTLNGLLPNREASDLPRDGTISQDPPARLDAVRPVLVDPAGGLVVSTNQPLFDPPQVNTLFSGSYRALRAYTALSARGDWTAEGLMGLQMDLLNLEATRLVPALIGALDGVELGLTEARMVTALAGWDYQMRADQAAPLIYEAWRGQLHRHLLSTHVDDPALVDAWLKSRLSEAPVTAALLDGSERWDDPDTAAVETRADAVSAALSAAAEQLTAAHGGRPARWAWGDAHRMVMEHPFATKAILRPWFGVDAIAIDGGRHALLAMGHYGALGDFMVDDGPAIRIAGSPDAPAQFVLAGGNAAQPRHPNALDQVDDWLVNRQHAMGGLAEEDAVGEVVLTP